MKVSLMAVMIIFLPGMVPCRAADVVSLRHHYALSDAAGHVAYVVTAVLDVSPVHDANTVLLEDFPAQQKYVIQRDFDIEHHRSSTEIRDPSGKRYIRLWFSIPSSAKTRKELLDEFHGYPNLPNIANSLMTIETPAFTHTTHDSDLTHTAEREEWVSELRQTLDPEFLEGIERMRSGALAMEDVTFFRLMFGAWLFHGNCPAAQTLQEVIEKPDCHFDESFGFSCSEKQRRQVDKADEEKRHLDRY